MVQYGEHGAMVGLLCACAWLSACSGRIDQSGPSAARARDRTGVAGAGAAGANGGTVQGSGTAGGVAGSGAAYVASDSVARRLSRAELDNSLRDLLGDDTNPATRLLPEDLYSPYDNDYPGQAASGALIDSLESLAADVAARALADSSRRAKLVSCTPSGAGDAACFRTVVSSFGARAFRRALRSDETDAYMTLLDFATENNPAVPHDFYTAVELFVRSVLQDPEFLYRIEVGRDRGDGRVFALSDYEIATRLSYLLWGTTPDDALLADAAAGKLSAAQGRMTAAQRMLGDPRARAQLHRFHAMWLGYRAIPQPPAIANAFARETSALIDRVVFDEPQSYLHLFTFDKTYIDAMLADQYGLPQPSGAAGWVGYGSSGRAGILSHGSVLSAFSKFTDTSPTQRGRFVRTRLLCQTIPPPPPNVMADKPPAGMNAVCKYDRYLEHRTSSSCAGCHNQMDPIGFGLENYDIAGRYRDHDDGHPECPIAGQGEVVGSGTFHGPAELGKLLVDQSLVQPCIVQQLVQFALGRAPSAGDQALLDGLAAAFSSSGYAFDQLLLRYAASDAFALRREPEAM